MVIITLLNRKYHYHYYHFICYLLMLSPLSLFLLLIILYAYSYNKCFFVHFHACVFISVASPSLHALSYPGVSSMRSAARVSEEAWLWVSASSPAASLWSRVPVHYMGNGDVQITKVKKYLFALDDGLVSRLFTQMHLSHSDVLAQPYDVETECHLFFFDSSWHEQSIASRWVFVHPL